MRKAAQFLIGLVISGLAFWLALRDAHLGDVAQALRAANYFYVPPVIAIIFIGQLARAMSWRTLLGPQLSFEKVFWALNAGYLLNNVLPLRLGELGRAYLISRGQPGLRSSQVVSSVLIERLLDLLIILLMLLAFIPLILGLAQVRETAFGFAGVGLAALIGLLILARQRTRLMALARWGLQYLPQLDAARWEARVGAFVDGLAPLANIRRALTAAFWSATAWLLAGVSTWVLLLSFWPKATLDMGFFVLIVTALGIAVPSAPAGVGVFEYAAVLALSAFSLTGAIAFSFAVLLHALIFLVTTGLGLIALSREGETVFHLAQTVQNLVSTSNRNGVPPTTP